MQPTCTEINGYKGSIAIATEFPEQGLFISQSMQGSFEFVPRLPWQSANETKTWEVKVQLCSRVHINCFGTQHMLRSYRVYQHQMYSHANMPTLTHEFGSKKQIFALVNYQDTQTNSGTPLIRTPLEPTNGVLIMGASYSRGRIPCIYMYEVWTWLRILIREVCINQGHTLGGVSM